MRVPPALMCWEMRTVSTVPATLDTQGMESPVWVSIAVFLLHMHFHKLNSTLTECHLRTQLRVFTCYVF